MQLIRFVFLALSVFLVQCLSAEKTFSLSTLDQRFKVTSPTLGLTHSLVLTLEQAGKDFDGLMGASSKDWKFPVHLYILTSSSEKGFERQVKFHGGTLIFNLRTSLSELETEELFSALSELLCYELASREIKDLSATESFSVLPFWLVDGIGQNLNRRRHKDFIRIVTGAVKRERAPTLLTLQSWKNPSENPLERWYQKAFNFWIVRELTFRETDRVSLGKWVRGSMTNPASETITYWTNLVSGGKWWSNLLQRGQKQPHDIFLTFESTQDQLRKILFTEAKLNKVTEKQPIPFKNFFQIPRDSQSFLKLKFKQKELWQLIERGNIFYQPIVQGYYQILSDLLSDKISSKQFQERVSEVETLQKTVANNYQAIQDYMNWFEVNQFQTMPELEFSSYFDWKAQWEAREAFEQLKQRERPFSILDWQR